MCDVHVSQFIYAPKAPSTLCRINLKAQLTLLLRLGLPSTLIHLYPHKKIHENGTLWKRFPAWNNLKTKHFFLLVWTENFFYP